MAAGFLQSKLLERDGGGGGGERERLQSFKPLSYSIGHLDQCEELYPGTVWD